MNENTIKQWCDRCGFLVRFEGHASRCRPIGFSDRSWSDTRVLAWYGDAIQSLDVKLALLFSNVPCAVWGEQSVLHTSNASMAVYVRGLGLLGRSEHTSGTAFEAHYFSEFRRRWLFATFPGVAQRVLDAWSPPVLDGLAIASELSLT